MKIGRVSPSVTCTCKHTQFYIDETGVNIMNLKFYPVASSRNMLYTYSRNRVAMYKLVNHIHKGQNVLQIYLANCDCVHKNVYTLESEYECDI